MEKQRVSYLDNLRVLAELAVIMIHASAQNWNLLSPNTLAWNVFNITDGLSRFAVPIFFAISGILFLDPKREVSRKKLYSKNLFHLVTAYAAWSLFYALLYGVRYGWSRPEILHAWLVGPYHFWFLHVMFGFYLLVPLLRNMAVSMKWVKRILLLLFLGSGITYVSHDTGWQYLVYSLDLGFYFFLGYYLHSVELSVSQQHICYGIGIIGAVLTILLTVIISTWNGEPNGMFLEYLSFNVMMEFLGVFTFGKYQLSKFHSPSIKKRVGILSDLCFGVYLIHVVILDALHIVGITTLWIHPIVGITVVFVFTSVSSFFASWILHKIPVVKQYFV
ncbi:MAG: acyltransferase family protein [Solobacterium sp.]|nr:acyltransferase family protein [Solobacterium sp.]